MQIIGVEHPYLDRFSRSFVLKTSEGPVLIDTGLHCRIYRLEAVAAHAGAVLCTHGHWDHIGGHAYFQRRGAKIYAHRGDGSILGDLSLQWRMLYEQFSRDFEIPPERRQTYEDGAGRAVAADVLLEDGQKLTFGDCELQVLATPGHSAGSVCFYLEREGVLFTGDTLCGDGFFGGLPQISCLPDYLSSLERLQQLAPQAVYSAHLSERLGPEEYREMLAKGMECALRLRGYTQEFLGKHAGPFTVGKVADFLCTREKKTGGSGACITALACLKSLSDDYPAAAACCSGYLL